MDFLSALLSLNFLILCLAVTALTTVFRKTVEYFLDKSPTMSKTSLFWTDVLLPISPVVLGLLFSCVASKYPYPEGFSVLSGRAAMGLVAGLLSTVVYRFILGLFKAKIKQENSE